MIEKAAEFIKNSGKKMGIVYGHDCDSIASAAIVFRLMKNLKKKPKLIVSSLNYAITDEDIKKIKNSKVDACVILDIGNIPEKEIKGLDEKIPVAIIDHHLPKKYAVSCYINPRLEDFDSYVPVSYIVWKVYSNFFNPSEVDWISAIGVLGDHGVEENKDLFTFLKKSKKELVKGKLTSESLFKNSLLGKIVKMVNSASIVKKRIGVLYATRLLIKSKSYKEVLRDRKLKKWYSIVENELKKVEKDFRKNRLVFDDLIFYIINSKYNLKSTFAGQLPEKYKNRIIIIGQKIGKNYEFSVRKGRAVDINLAKLVKKLEEKIDGLKGGGHPSASGFRIPAKKLSILIEKLKKEERNLL